MFIFVHYHAIHVCISFISTIYWSFKNYALILKSRCSTSLTSCFLGSASCVMLTTPPTWRHRNFIMWLWSRLFTARAQHQLFVLKLFKAEVQCSFFILSQINWCPNTAEFTLPYSCHNILVSPRTVSSAPETWWSIWVSSCQTAASTVC